MTQQKPVAWIEYGKQFVGTKEIPGKQHSPAIVNMLIRLNAWWKDDETPWCGVFVGDCLKQSGRAIPKDWYRAKAYADYGTLLSKPAYGALAVMSRQGGGHVGIVVGQDAAGNILLLGGNQGNMVSVAAFPRARITHYVWPAYGDGRKSEPNEERYQLPIGKAAFSRSEA